MAFPGSAATLLNHTVCQPWALSVRVVRQGRHPVVISLAFLWHQHQPYYPDDVAGDNLMPWVRLHGVKDYYGMARHLLEFPEMACTINLVPSLLVQLQAYCDAKGTDKPLIISRKPAY